jgi:hypothetical protein
MVLVAGGSSSIAAESGSFLQSETLAARSGPRGATLFTTLSPEETGVKASNAYDDLKMWGEHYREFSLGSIGTGVAIGDFDGDGKPDIFVVSKTGPNHLFRNLGNFKFEDVTEHAGVGGPVGPWKQGAAFVDVNNDGRLDLYVCRFGAPNLLYINQGDGTFREEAAARGLALADASNMAAFCDYDRDGWIDVYVQTNLLDGESRPNGQRDHLYHNNRDGTFTDVSDAAGISGLTQGHAATWWDYNEDGWPDLYVDNDFKDPDQLYRNNGDGTFTNVLSWVVPHTPQSSMGADLGDVNNDGHIDLLVADMARTSRYQDHRGMAKLRTGMVEDMERPEAAPQYMHNALFLNQGAGVVLEGALMAGLAATDWTWSVRLEDLDNDGRLDAYFTNGMVRELDGTDVTQRMVAKESLSERVRIIKATPPLAQRHLAFRNLGDLHFEETGAAWGLDHVGVGFGAAFGDLDGDGDLDLVFATMDGNVTVCRNDNATGHSIEVALHGTSSNRFGVGATVRLDTAAGPQIRTLTLARGYLSTSEPILHFGLGAVSGIKSLSVEWPNGRVQTFADLDVDRRYTITEDAQAPLTRHPVAAPAQFQEISSTAHLNVQNHEQPLDETATQPLLPIRLNRVGPSAVVARLDADSEDDLVLGGVAGESGQLYSNLGGGQFLGYGGSIFTESAAVADGPILALDADGDGDLDLFVTKAGVAATAGASIYQPRMLLNDGAGRFTPAPEGFLPALPISVGAAAAADFEHSGRLGIFVGGRVVPGNYPKAPRSAMLVWRENRWVDVIREVAPSLADKGMVTGAVWSDVDGDGWADLVVTYEWGSVACFRNIEGKHLEDVSEKIGFNAAGRGWWSSVASADFNGDGRPDFVVGNVGLNTRYRASPEEPAVLYDAVALDGSSPQLVEVQAEHGRWFPLRARESMLKVFPSLGRRFPTADSYAKATVEEVFGAEALAAATKFTATEFRSGVFLSQPDGTYRFAPLPPMAQIAPIYGLVAGDFDGDGRADMMCVGNTFSPIPETGHFDGGVGWLLHGDGHGGFQTVPSSASGWVVKRDARALAVIDFNQDGWPDFVVTRNNDRALAFLNRGVPGRHSFGIVLRGHPGNPTAVGARLTLLLADGTAQTSEIAAGSGYFSQSSSTAFFGYPDGAAPVSLKIRWPDGRETAQTFSAVPPKILRITSP